MYQEPKELCGSSVKNISRNLNVTECYKHFDKPLKVTAVNLRNYESLVASIYIMVFSLSIKVLLMRIQWTHHVPCFNTIQVYTESINI